MLLLLKNQRANVTLKCLDVTDTVSEAHVVAPQGQRQDRQRDADPHQAVGDDLRHQRNPGGAAHQKYAVDLSRLEVRGSDGVGQHLDALSDEGASHLLELRPRDTDLADVAGDQ